MPITQEDYFDFCAKESDAIDRLIEDINGGDGIESGTETIYQFLKKYTEKRDKKLAIAVVTQMMYNLGSMNFFPDEGFNDNDGNDEELKN